MHFHYYLNITLDGLSFVKRSVHSFDVYMQKLHSNEFIYYYLFLLIKKKTTVANEARVSKPNKSKCPLLYV